MENKQTYIIRPVKQSSTRYLRTREVCWWIFTMVPRKKKHSGPYYSRWEAQQQLDQILNR